MRKISFISLSIILTLFLCLSLVFPLGSEKGRDNNLSKVIKPLIKQGYDIDPERSIKGVLDKGTSINYMIPLDYDGNYVIVAAGDETALDIDIKVLDEDGKTVISDSSQSSTAKVFIKPEWSGAFFVYITMKNCKDPSSYYVSLYGFKETD